MQMEKFNRFGEEMTFFIANQDNLISQYKDKVLVIKGSEIVGVYNSALEAYLDASSKYEEGTFMIQPCMPGPDAYTVTINSTEVFL